MKITLDRQEDIRTTGQRERFLIKYKVGFNNDGRMIAVDYRV